MVKRVLLLGAVGGSLAVATGLAGCSNASTTELSPAGAGGAGGSNAANTTIGQGGQPEPRCGDNICQESADESCESCPFDCGDCPTCEEAPTCTGALSVPTESEKLESCDNEEKSVYSCGSDVGVPVERTDCTDPQLRFRVRQIKVKRGDLITKRMYCIVTAEDGAHSELLITPISEVPYGDSILTFPVSQALFWGQDDLYPSISNVTITYDCYESLNADGYQQLVDDVADAAGDAAENAGGYGWVFGAVSVAGKIISGALGNVTDRKLLNVQQTIDADALLELTQGRRWTIQKKGGFGASYFNVRLQVETWGCALPTTKNR